MDGRVDGRGDVLTDGRADVVADASAEAGADAPADGTPEGDASADEPAAGDAEAVATADGDPDGSTVGDPDGSADGEADGTPGGTPGGVSDAVGSGGPVGAGSWVGLGVAPPGVASGAGLVGEGEPETDGPPSVGSGVATATAVPVPPSRPVGQAARAPTASTRTHAVTTTGLRGTCRASCTGTPSRGLRVPVADGREPPLRRLPRGVTEGPPAAAAPAHGRVRHDRLVTDVGSTVGVEEEYHLVDADTMALADAPDVVAEAVQVLGGRAQGEISTSQLEVASDVLTTLADVRREVGELRRGADAAAQRHGCRILPTGTHPWGTWLDQTRTPDSPLRRA